jgi:hypothetical protein
MTTAVEMSSSEGNGGEKGKGGGTASERRSSAINQSEQQTSKAKRRTSALRDGDKKSFDETKAKDFNLKTLVFYNETWFKM